LIGQQALSIGSDSIECIKGVNESGIGSHKKSSVMKQVAKLVFLSSFTIFCWSCSTAEPIKTEKPVTQTKPITQCTNPRPEVCTREYRPVCATKDTGIRCVTTPCPSTEEVTYATGCTACADPKVSHYRPGKCKS